MWVSKKRWRDLEKRVEELEKTVNSPITIDSEELKAAIQKSWDDYSKMAAKRASTTLSQ